MKHAGSLDNDFISARFRQAREQKGLALKDAAEALGCTPQLLGKIEKGSAKDTADRGLVTRAADAYGVNAAWLWAGTCAPPRFWPAWVK
jgi:transcriptional regulator with XRE-family HTH domain